MEVSQWRCVQVPRGPRRGRLAVLWWSGDASWRRGSRTVLKEEGKAGARSELERAGDAWEIMGNTGQELSEISEVNREAPWKTAFLRAVPWLDLTKGLDISLHAALPSLTLPHPTTGLFLPQGWLSWDILTAASRQGTVTQRVPARGGRGQDPVRVSAWHTGVTLGDSYTAHMGNRPESPRGAVGLSRGTWTQRTDRH